MSETKARLRKLLEEHFGPTTALEAKDDEALWRTVEERRAAGGGTPDGHLDSLDKVEFMMLVEEEFYLKINDEIAERLNTIGDIAEHIDLLIASKNAAGH